MVKRARVQATATADQTAHAEHDGTAAGQTVVEEEEESARRAGCFERLVRLIAFECFGMAIRRVSDNQRRASRYFLRFQAEADPVKLLFKERQVSMGDRRRWMQIWADIDSSGANQAQFADFAWFMRLKQQDRGPDSWWRRVFDMMNTDFSGRATFQQFVVFAWRYCTLEKPKVVEFSFRLLSRRGGTSFIGEQHVITLDDLQFFAAYRYPTFPTKLREKRCIQLLQLIDEDDSGGLAFSEFEQFVKTFPSFLSFGFKFLWRLRTRIMGDQYWNRGVHDQGGKMEVDVAWTRDVFATAQKFWRQSQPAFDDDFRGLAVTLRKRKLARQREQMEERQRQQKEFLSRLKTTTYTRVWNACLDASLSRGKLRPAFITWKDVAQAAREREVRLEEEEEKKEQAKMVAEASMDVYAKILADTDAVARVDEAVLANLCKTTQLAIMQGRAVGGEVHRMVVSGRHGLLKEENIRWPVAAATSIA